MKTPDEIKKGLECCSGVGRCFGECPYYNGNTNIECIRHKSTDALAYIQQLEAVNEAYKHAASKCCYESRCNAQIKELETLCGRLMDEKEQQERERDALVDIIKYESTFYNLIPLPCRCCKNNDGDYTKDKCRFCGMTEAYGNFEWRGVKEE